jgi:hypothetical protein
MERKMNVRERIHRDPIDLLRAANPVSPARHAELAAEGDTPTVNDILDRARSAAHRSRAVRGRLPTGRRRIALIAGVAGLIAFAGSALGVGLSDYLSQQEAIDNQAWTPPDMKAVGARVEVARGADWSFMAWKSTKGICVAYAAGAADGWARSCGFLPGSTAGPDASKYLGVLLTSASDDGVSDGLGAIVGAVGPPVARVDLELSDGRVISARTQAAPPALKAAVRLFLVRTRLVVSGGTPPGPRVNSITSYGRDGTRLERFSTSLG